MSLQAPNLLFQQRFNTQFSDTQIKGFKASTVIQKDVEENTSTDKTPFKTRFHNHIKVTTVNEGYSCTDENLLPNTDLKTIVNQYLINGLKIPVPSKEMFGNIVQSTELGDVITNVNQGNVLFNQLPAQLKAQFNNSLVEFSKWCKETDDLTFAKTMDKHGIGDYSRDLRVKSAYYGDNVNVPDYIKYPNLSPKPEYDDMTGTITNYENGVFKSPQLQQTPSVQNPVGAGTTVETNQ